MRHGARNCLLRVLLLAGVLAAALTQAHAISFRFSPGGFSMEAKPGQLINRVFTLTLAKDAPTTHFQAHVEDWWRSADNRSSYYRPPGTISRSCGLWCSVNPVEQAVKPGETFTTKLSIRIPDDVKPGGYWAALTVDEVPDPLAPKPQGVAMTFRASVSTGIFIEIPPVTRSAKITGVHVTGENAVVTLRNDGNTPLRVNGRFEFYNSTQEEPLATVEFGGEALLPEPINTCECTVPLPDKEKLPSGTYRSRVIVDVGLDYLLGAEKGLNVTRTDSH